MTEAKAVPSVWSKLTRLMWLEQDVAEPNVFPSAYPMAEWDRKILFEQYKLAVEMWDRVRARRRVVNSFYVTINSGLITAFMAAKVPSSYLRGAAALAGIVVCASWWFTLMNYKTLTEGKSKVIAKLEERLPSTPFGAEPGASAPVSFTEAERFIPMAFAVLYLCMFL